MTVNMTSDVMLAMHYLRNRLNEKKPPTLRDVCICEDAANEIQRLRQEVARLEEEIANLSEASYK